MSAKLHVPPITKTVHQEWMRVPEFAAFIEWPEYQVYRWVARGDLPTYIFYRNLRLIRMTEMKTPNEIKDESHQFMSVDEFAKWVRVSTLTVRRALVHPHNPIPHIRIGGSVRIERDLALAQARNRASQYGVYKQNEIPRHIPAKSLPWKK